MSCFEFLLNKAIAKDIYMVQLQEIFAIPCDRISFVDELNENALFLNAELICVQNKIKGEFVEQLIIYSKNHLVKKITEKELALQLCRINNMQALISDSNIDPYMMQLVDANGKINLVNLDVDAFDMDIYILEKQ